MTRLVWIPKHEIVRPPWIKGTRPGVVVAQIVETPPDPKPSE